MEDLTGQLSERMWRVEQTLTEESMKKVYVTSDVRTGGKAAVKVKRVKAYLGSDAGGKAQI